MRRGGVLSETLTQSVTSHRFQIKFVTCLPAADSPAGHHSDISHHSHQTLKVMTDSSFDPVPVCQNSPLVPDCQKLKYEKCSDKAGEWNNNNTNIPFPLL